jgi:hypothetical protein
MRYQQRETRFGELALACDLSRKSNQNFSRGWKTFRIGKQRSAIDHMDTETGLAGEPGYRHCHLAGTEHVEIRTETNRINEHFNGRLLRSERSLEKLSSQVLGWSGGTNIGSSFSTFNRSFARELVNDRTVVMVLSDGWDCGDVDLLGEEMKNLKRRCRKILWLNPLLGSENYEPLYKGMQAVLPYLDYFLPAHNLESLVALGRTPLLS